MSEWKKVRLGEMLNIRKGQPITKREAYPGQYPVILGGQEPAYFIDKYNHVGKAIVISRSGASAGYVSFWDEPIFVTDGFLIEPKDCTSIEFLFYALKNRQGQLHNLQRGSAIPHVTPALLAEVETLLPPRPVQDRIASVLSNYDSAIANCRRQIALLEEAAMRLYREWFKDGKGEKIAIGSLVDTTISGSWGTDTETVKTPNAVVCIRGADFEEINRRSLGKRIRRFVSNKHLAERGLRDGDLVVEMSGGSPTQSTGRIVAVSKALLTRYGVPVLSTNFCKVIRPKKGFSYFVYLAWRDLYESRIMFNYEVGTTGIKNFDYDLFASDVKVINPSSKLSQFNELVGGLFSSMDVLGALIQSLTEARDRLLPKLMKGEIAV